MVGVCNNGNDHFIHIDHKLIPINCISLGRLAQLIKATEVTVNRYNFMFNKKEKRNSYKLKIYSETGKLSRFLVNGEEFT